MQGGGTAAWAAWLGQLAAWAAARAVGRGGQLAALTVVGTVLLAPLPLVQGQASTPSFAAATSFTVGTSPFSMAVADVNGDGRPDLLVANQLSNTVSVLLNQTAPGAATPIFASATNLGTGATPRSVTSTDVNGDGLPDLIVANDGSNTVSVLLNQTAPGAGTLSFAAATSFSVGTNPRSVAAADVNGDGLPDLIVANTGSGTVSVLLNTTAPGATTPSFATATSFIVGTSPTSVAVADVNGDGKPDLLVANQFSGTVSVLLNTTAPGATTPSFAAATSFSVGASPTSVAVADVNGDGKPDLLVANQGSDSVSVLLNQTAPGAAVPSFAAATSFTVGTQPRSVAAADVNGDGKLDLLVANAASNNVSVLLNQTAPGATTPSFATATSFTAGANPAWAVAVDVNGDGRPDLIVANYVSNNVSVLLNTTAAGAAPPSFAGPYNFSVGSFPMSVAAVDVNGDGHPDLLVANSGSHTVSVLLNLDPSPTPTPSPTITPTPTLTSTPTATGTPTQTPTTTQTPTATSTPSATPAPSSTATATGTPTQTPTPNSTSVPTPTSTPTPTTPPTPTATAPPTATPFPRPNVGVQATPDFTNHVLQVVLTARDAGCAGGNNQLQSLRFTGLVNATVDVPGVGTISAASAVPVALAGQPPSVSLTVHRVAEGATTVQVVVTDGCGAWPTFFGGGPSAF